MSAQVFVSGVTTSRESRNMINRIARHSSATAALGMNEMLQKTATRIAYPQDAEHRYMIISHLFNDTMRMLRALQPLIQLDAIVGIPYSSNQAGLKKLWQDRFATKDTNVYIESNLRDTESVLLEQLDRSLFACRKLQQKLIVQECGGFVVPLLHSHFENDLHLVKGVVEITKQGVWRSQEQVQELRIPVLHCADSELKRLEAKRCGETIARCLDGVARDLGVSLAGRHATVFGAGWIGSGVCNALRRLDVIPSVIDPDPLKVMEARLDGYSASTTPREDWLGQSHLVVGASGRTSITEEVLESLPNGAIVASASSRQLEIDVEYLKDHFDSSRVSEAVESFFDDSCSKEILLVNDGFPANFLPGSGSVPDEIVETILAELMVLMRYLATTDHVAPGIHRITPRQEQAVAELWLELRDKQIAVPPTRVSPAGSRAFHCRSFRPRGVSLGTSAKAFCTSARGARFVRSKSTMTAIVAPPLDAGARDHPEVEAASENKNQVSSVDGHKSHSPYLVKRLVGQKPNLYGVAKFAIVSEEIRKVARGLDRPIRILDLGCSTSISYQYLEANDLDGGFEYCGVDYEAAFDPDIVMDIRELNDRRDELPWVPDVILLLDVLEHLPGKARAIEQVMHQCNELIPSHGLVLAVVPQLYRLDRLKLSHLHYPEHQVRYTLEEWYEIIKNVTTVQRIRGIGYISCLPYAPMFSPFYREDNLHGALFRYLRGTLFEWGPLKPLEIALSKYLGTVDLFKGWCNSSLLICKGNDGPEKKDE